MALPLPDLDDRRWADLVEEARALIPVYAPALTDHNASDPGMTLVDLLAWVTEADLYGINRIRDPHRLRFLSLLGVHRAGPRPAETAVRFDQVGDHDGPAEVVRLPQGTEVEARRQPVDIVFRTLAPVDVQPGRLVAVLLLGSSGVVDRTVRWEQGRSLQLLGAAPREGDALHLGFDRAIAPGGSLRLFVRLDPDGHGRNRSDAEERRRLVAEPPATLPRTTMPAQAGVGPTHHSVRLVWEYRGPSGRWYPVAFVDDETRGLTLDGHVVVHLPPAPAKAMAAATLCQLDQELFYVRCRLDRGSYDAPPTGRLVPNAVKVEQAVPTASIWEVPVDVPAPPDLEPGVAVPLGLRFDLRPDLLKPGADARLELLSVASEATAEQPPLRVLHYDPASDDRPGSLHVEAEWLGGARGVPFERFELARSLLLPATLQVFTIEDGVWREWSRRDDHLGSRREDRHYVIDLDDRAIVLGDGERGRVAPPGADLVATYEVTLGDAGNLASEAIREIAESVHNTALIGDLPGTRAALTVTNPLNGRDGAPSETPERALGRGFLAREERTRAVTLEDCEMLALQTPGTRIARTAARADVHPGFPCHTAPGLITVVVIPWLPVNEPQPSVGLVRAVQAYLDSRTLLGTRIIVVGPAYRSVAVQARIRALPDADPDAVRERSVAALDAFFHPLHGGPAGTGWPLGRAVYRSEVLQVLDESAGVDHVSSLELLVDDGEPSCGNVCLSPIELVTSARHRIEAVR